MGLACARRLAAMVDTLLLVDMDEVAVTAAAGELASAAGLASAGHQAAVEPFVLDVTDQDGLARLASFLTGIDVLVDGGVVAAVHNRKR
jgi:NAD(P)-dependent dehydrogenase (short-subunit alcohol dehydrogenase family)